MFQQALYLIDIPFLSVMLSDFLFSLLLFPSVELNADMLVLLIREDNGRVVLFNVLSISSTCWVFNWSPEKKKDFDKL